MRTQPLDPFDLQNAIEATCGLLTTMPRDHSAQNDLGEHLDLLLAEQKLRAISNSDTLRNADPSAPAARVAQGDVVLDPARGLMWARKPISAERLNFAAAEAACAGLRLAGHADWRLPTREELQSLVDYNRYNPAIDPELFPDTPPNYFWSSSPDASGPDYAWIVNFSYGHVGLDGRDYGAFVRAVRSVPASQ